MFKHQKQILTSPFHVMDLWTSIYNNTNRFTNMLYIADT